MNPRHCALSVLALLSSSAPLMVDGFSSALFQEAAGKQVTASSRHHGVEIELPDFDELFSRIRQTSPLATLALDHGNELAVHGKRGLAALEHLGAYSLSLL